MNRSDLLGAVVARLCPNPPRRIPHVRLLAGGFRSVHIAAFALLLGGHAADVPAERLLTALWLTIATGVALIGLELVATAAWLLEVRGLAVLGKLALLLIVPLAWDHRVTILLAVVVLASATSHMPGRLRHASLASWGGALDVVIRAVAPAAGAAKGERS